MQSDRGVSYEAANEMLDAAIAANGGKLAKGDGERFAASRRARSRARSQRARRGQRARQ